MLRLLVVLLRISGFTLARCRVADGSKKALLLRANDLFGGVAQRPLTCDKAADSNDDGRVDIADPVYLFNHLFKNGPALAPPAGECGADLTSDELRSEEFAGG